jgi:hypothetical protein
LLSLTRNLRIDNQHLTPSHLVSTNVFDFDPAYHVLYFRSEKVSLASALFECNRPWKSMRVVDRELTVRLDLICQKPAITASEPAGISLRSSENHATAPENDWTEWPMAELCRVLGISRKTGYRIFDLYLAAINQGISSI